MRLWTSVSLNKETPMGHLIEFYTSLLQWHYLSIKELRTFTVYIPEQVKTFLTLPAMSWQTLYLICRIVPDNSVWFHRRLQVHHRNKHDLHFLPQDIVVPSHQLFLSLVLPMQPFPSIVPASPRSIHGERLKSVP